MKKPSTPAAGDTPPPPATTDPATVTQSLASDATTPAAKQPSQPNTSVGRIVHYYPDGKEARDAKGQAYPAIITHVHNATCVNLNVFQDGEYPLTDLKPVRVCQGAHDGRGAWTWPPKV